MGVRDSRAESTASHSRPREARGAEGKESADATATLMKGARGLW